MKFEINDLSEKSIVESFDEIAKELLYNYSLLVNGKEIEFTEIEFYYFKTGIHEDKSVHQHDYKAGMWRFHRAGLDITFESTETSDGGILIRGIKDSDKYTNGSLRVVTYIFKQFGNVEGQGSLSLIKKKKKNNILTIYKSPRHGLGKTVSEEFKKKKYRYSLDVENWDKKHFSKKNKEAMFKNRIELI